MVRGGKELEAPSYLSLGRGMAGSCCCEVANDPVAKTLHTQCMGLGFSPWSGNQIPRAARKTEDPTCHASLSITNSRSSLKLMCIESVMHPDTPGSPEGNTEGPGTASSEPLLPS